MTEREKLIEKGTIKPDPNAPKEPTHFRPTCWECGFKIRGPGHDKGTHHKMRHPSMRKEPYKFGAK